MVSNVEAIQTQAFQIWTKPDAAHMRTPRHGAHDNPDAEPPVFGGFAQPHNTIADMSHLLPRESWPPSTGPRAVYYFCGPLSQPAVMPPRSESEFPRIQSIKANARASEWLRSNAQFVLPGSMFAGYPESFPDTFNFSLLYDSQGPQVPAVDQFDRQFWRANSDPTELYVLSTKGSTKFRLRAAASGYSNLKLAGDWTFTGLNYGCVEAATMSGMEAARAICGSPTIIFGENFPLP
jgi:uncharacterized protein with NAD-binding domain and iron-sulfur cluster